MLNNSNDRLFRFFYKMLCICARNPELNATFQYFCILEYHKKQFRDKSQYVILMNYVYLHDSAVQCKILEHAEKHVSIIYTIFMSITNINLYFLVNINTQYHRIIVYIITKPNSFPLNLIVVAQYQIKLHCY